MKIIKLNIFDKSHNLIRKIKFNLSGVSFLFTDVDCSKKISKNSNVLDNTLVLKFIDFILGKYIDENKTEPKILNYYIEAVILFKNKKYHIKRIFEQGNFNNVFVNDKKMSLKQYITSFNIKRELFSSQISLSNNSKSKLLNYQPYLEILKLDNLSQLINKIYNLRKELSILKISKKEIVKQLIKTLDKKELEVIDELFFWTDKDIKKLEKTTKNNLDIINNNKRVVIDEKLSLQYEIDSKNLKIKLDDIQKLTSEKERLLEFLDSMKEEDVKSSTIISILEMAKQQVPEMVKKHLIKVEKFHKNITTDRKEILEKKIENINEHINILSNEIEEIKFRIESFNNIVSKNTELDSSLIKYNQETKELKKLKYQKGELSNLEQVINSINSVSKEIKASLMRLNETLRNYDDVISKYRTFLCEMTKKCYSQSKNVITFFNIEIDQKKITKNLLKFILSLNTETNERSEKFKNCIIDYLVFNFNNYIPFLLQDYSCFNGLELQQIKSIIQEVKTISEKNNKQLIIAINKSQVIDDKFLDQIKFSAV